MRPFPELPPERDDVVKVRQASLELARVSMRLMAIGAALFTLGRVIGWRWIWLPGIGLLGLGALANLIRFLPIRPFWK